MFAAAVIEIVFLHVFQFWRVSLAAAALATDIDFNRLLGRCTWRDGLATVISLCLPVAGCADAEQTLTGVSQTPTAGEMAARVAALAARNKVAEAIATGEPFLRNHPDPQGPRTCHPGAAPYRTGDPGIRTPTIKT